MFSIEDDIDFSDEEINFSILNTPIPKQTSLKPTAKNENFDKRKSDDGTKSSIVERGSTSSKTNDPTTLVPIEKQMSSEANLLETPKTKKYKFAKTSNNNVHTPTHTTERNITLDSKRMETPKMNKKPIENTSSMRFKFTRTSFDSHKADVHSTRFEENMKKKNCFDVPENFFDDDDDDDDLLSLPNKIFASSKENKISDIKTPISNSRVTEPDLPNSLTSKGQCMRQSTNVYISRTSTGISTPQPSREPDIQNTSNSNRRGMRKTLSTPLSKNKPMEPPNEGKSSSHTVTKTFKNIIQTPKTNNTNIRRTSKTPGDTTQRKFPGPAGNLPKLNNMNELDKLRSPEFNTKRKAISPIAPRTPLQIIQSTPEENCHTESFSTMLEYVSNNFPNESLLSINEILYKSSQRKLHNCKVPLLCGIVKSFSMVNNSGRLVLEDSTGEINGAMHNDILDEYQKGLGKGSGLILKDVSVFSPTVKRHYLNITPSNIAAFFERDLADDQLTQFTQVTNNSTIILDNDTQQT